MPHLVLGPNILMELLYLCNQVGFSPINMSYVNLANKPVKRTWKGKGKVFLPCIWTVYNKPFGEWQTEKSLS